MTTSLLMVLFSQNQPYTEAMLMPCDTVFELTEAKLDEMLSVLDEEKERLARKELAIVKEHGSVKDLSAKILGSTEAPSL
ncbi:hypothetical protein Pan258_01790 [Symmachiella dynata]|uniref:hypothetical protein n=1 Tax=Symmachiella dynata TaxID=2527995 RepID=UPI00118949F8|nr:hypothetical protein [Symmachiella dynata]QDT46162.1 hypothetical protein Pan258_01790 [Symmachiella dynata]